MLRISESREKPPIYEALKQKFGADWDKGLLIAWDGKIHSKEPAQAQKILHESVHLREQSRLGNEAWWRLYLENEDFRFQQELMAYREEARFIRENVDNREAAFKMIREAVHSFCSDLYGFKLDYQEGWKLINEKK